ncbi:universal stress protein [Halovenus marina]|uniref:universal stress protein n=1 Tax=Halovenus marina TaxID=3396621 RepID=UPI003F55AB92
MTHVLVPVAVLDGETVSSGLIDLLGTVNVTVLGYHVLPEQTPPDQARAQFEERATSALEDIAEEFRAAGGDAYHRLVFTGDRRQTIDRVAAEIGVDAYAVTGATGAVDRLLVPLSGSVAVSRILAFVESLVGGRPIGVTLLAAGSVPESRLDESAATLREADIETETRMAAGDPFDALVEAIPGHDAVVMGEAAPSLASLLFGEESERVAAATVGPVLVVRRESAEEVSESEAETQ